LRKTVALTRTGVGPLRTSGPCSLLKHLQPHVAENRRLTRWQIGEASRLTELSDASCGLQVRQRLVDRGRNAPFLTLSADSLAETGKRQCESKGDANVTRRHGVDCRKRYGKKKFAPSFFRQAKCNAVSGVAQHRKERLKLPELVRKRTDCRIDLPRLSLLDV
jgi:hypothetical protein